MIKSRKLLTVMALALATGCALNRPKLEETTTTTDKAGNVVVQRRSLKVTSYAFWPAQTEVSKQTASVGKTLSTGVAGLREETGGTNVVEALKSIDSILGKVRP
jgi:hypothetical protein